MNYSIGQTSRLVGLSAKTIRFYEQVKVITSPGRKENGYRHYSDDDIEALKLIKSARDLGLPLSEIKKLMVGCSNGNCAHSQTEIDKDLSNYLELLDQNIARQQHLKKRLTQLKQGLATNSCTEDTFCCDLLHQLINPTKGGELQ